MKSSLLIVFFLLITQLLNAQPVPAADENVPYLVTFGKNASITFGDDDFNQTFFFVVPKGQVNPVYFRVYDPDIGGEIDEVNGKFNSTTQFSIYGGNGAISNKDAQAIHPTGNYKSGTLLATKTFGEDKKYDKNWYTFGPFNPQEGENMPVFGGYVFKVMAEGVTGDDGNLYRYFMSTKPNENVSVEGGNVFTYEYTFRMHENADNVSHIYPYIDDKVTSVMISNFDMDDDGVIRIISSAKNGKLSKVSGDGNWVHEEHAITKAELNTSLDIQFIKDKNKVVKNNNIVVYVTNQYGQFLPFFVIPIGGVPKYKYKIGVKVKK